MSAADKGDTGNIWLNHDGMLIVYPGPRKNYEAYLKDSEVYTLRSKILISASTAATALDWDRYNLFIVDVSASTTFSIDNARPDSDFVIVLRKDGTGSPYTLTWPGSVTWLITPIVSLTTADEEVVLQVSYYDGTFRVGYFTGQVTTLVGPDVPTKAQVQNQVFTHSASVAGTVDAITIVMDPVSTAYTTNEVIRWKSAGANTVTAPTINKDGLGNKIIKKGASLALVAGDLGVSGTEHEAVYNGTDYILQNPASSASIPSLASTTEVLTGTDAAKTATPDAIAALWEQGSDIASAGTISVGEGGYFNVTGTTTITDIDFATDKAGRKAWLKFASTPVLTHNATTLILPSGANITAAAGDTACFVSEGSDNVRCISYTRANGTALVATSSGPTAGTVIATTSGSTASFTGLPTGIKEITISLAGVSSTAGFGLQVRISTGGTFATTAYVGACARLNTGANLIYSDATAFAVTNTATMTGGDVVSGTITLKLLDSATNLWSCSSTLGADLAYVFVYGGHRALSGVLDGVRLLTTGTFDAGSVNIMYQ